MFRIRKTSFGIVNSRFSSALGEIFIDNKKFQQLIYQGKYRGTFKQALH